MPIKWRDAKAALQKKGFKQEPNRDHQVFAFYYKAQTQHLHHQPQSNPSKVSNGIHDE
jgi:hypothetical protein